MPEWIQRLVPAGTSGPKLAAVGGLLLVALGVVTYDVAWLAEDESVVHAGTDAIAADVVAAPEAVASAPAEAALVVDPALAPGVSGVSAAPAAPAAPGAPAVPAAGEPDWAALFAQLMARSPSGLGEGGLELEAVLPDGELQERLSGFQLRGLVRDADGGVALVNGRLLRAGDALPGTTLVVSVILEDRILLGSPDRTTLVPLLLEPMGHGSAGVP